ncbi:MAG: HNH endonuclease [Dehalococcoidia bacterium]|nr:HNH endonuclease [Dehalococcoidia bacterium]
MATYILTWNPDRWSWDELDQQVARLRRNEPALDRWSTGNTKSVVVGDRLFLLKQGQEPRGIMGSGWATSDVFRDDHWDSVRAAAGDKANYVNVDFDSLVAPDAVLPVSDLVQADPLGSVHWNSMPASGFGLSDDAAEAMEQLWREHLGRVSTPTPQRLPEEVEDSRTYVEGAVTRICVNAYERDRTARAACVEHWGDSCLVCGFRFEDYYGALGLDYIHVHHLKPLGEIGEEYVVDPKNDLRPVCPNCHAMLHRETPPISIERLRQIVHKRSSP